VSQSQLFTPADSHDAGVVRRMRVPADVRVTAEINGAYRCKLKHLWSTEPATRLVLWLMMNPSDARIEYTDATIAKCSRLSRRWGFDGLMVGNACDYRHKSPNELLKVARTASDRNMPAIREMADEAQIIVVAHGRLPRGLEFHGSAMTLMLRSYGYKLHAVKLLSDGCPGHPLYVPEDSVPIPY
jgi:hypothetical protein